MDNMELWDAWHEVPAAAQKKIKGGRLAGMTDINPMWRIQQLTKEFGPCGVGWKIKNTEYWLEEADNETAAFCKLELCIKVDGEWSEPIPGIGGSKLVASEKNGLYVSDEAYKMAYTDALSVCCKMLGMGADVYWEAGTKYSAPQTDENPLGGPVCAHCGKPITDEVYGGKHYSAAQICKSSKDKYGVYLHIGCKNAWEEAQE